MKRSNRQLHRRLEIAFTLTVVANFVVRPRAEPPTWIAYSPLAPLLLLIFSKPYLFVLPYIARRRGRPYPDGVSTE